jgi:hypothetical protein
MLPVSENWVDRIRKILLCSSDINLSIPYKCVIYKHFLIKTVWKTIAVNQFWPTRRHIGMQFFLGTYQHVIVSRYIENDIVPSTWCRTWAKVSKAVILVVRGPVVPSCNFGPQTIGSATWLPSIFLTTTMSHSRLGVCSMCLTPCPPDSPSHASYANNFQCTKKSESAFAFYVGFGVLMTSKLRTNVILITHVAAISPMKDLKSWSKMK